MSRELSHHLKCTDQQAFPPALKRYHAHLTVVNAILCVLDRGIAICRGIVAVEVRLQSRDAHFGLLGDLSELRRGVSHVDRFSICTGVEDMTKRLEYLLSMI